MCRSRLVLAAAAALVLSLLSTSAAADPLLTPEQNDSARVYLHLRTPSTVTTDGGSTLRLPPGYFLDEPTWDELDAEVKRLQKKSADRPGWKVIGIAVLVGITIGVVAY